MRELFELRSDTFTLPSEGMRDAIRAAEVGDDVYGEDPTVNALEAYAASLLGKRRAMLVSSGSMGNLIGLFVNCGRGNEVLCASSSHIIHHEVASAATIAQVLPIAIDAPRGILSPALLEGKVKPRGDYAAAATTMIEVENTIGGFPYSLAQLQALRAFADANGLKIHMDGARLFNAALAEGTTPAAMAAFADDVTVCLSKGLGAPVGAILASDSDEFAYQARRVRKMLGGGMRQAGFLAAAGLYALRHNVQRLADDHRNAALIAEALAATSWASVDLDQVRTNIVLFDAKGLDNASLEAQLNEAGVLCLSDGGKIRLVANLNLSNEQVPRLLALIRGFQPRRGR